MASLITAMADITMQKEEIIEIIIITGEEKNKLGDKTQFTYYCIQRRKNALLIRIGVNIAWDNVGSVNGWILGRASGIIHPQIFCRGR